jgi:catecholate siderophore receptor
MAAFGTHRVTPVTTALAGIVFGPAALAQQALPEAGPPAAEPAPTPPTETAQPAPASGAPATLAPVTVTGSRPSDDFAPPPPSLQRLGNDLQDIPQTVVVINKALMQSQGATSLQGAVRNLPGVTLGAAEGSSIGNNINLNGFSARTDLYVDGMRDPGQYYRDVYTLEQIEVLMGPSSMLFGRGSTGGVINQVLKKPSLKKAIEVTVSGSSNLYERGTADVNIPIDDHSAVRVNTMFQNGNMSTRQQTAVRDFGVAPSYKTGIGTPTEITLYGQLQYNHDQADYGLPPINGLPANVSPNLAYGFSNDRTDQTVAMLGSTIEHSFESKLKLRNQTQFNFVNSDVVETAPQSVGTVNAAGVFTALTNGYTGVPLSGLWVRQQSHDRNIFDTSLDNQTELSGDFKTGAIGHTALLGLEFGLENYYNQNYARNGTCGGTALTATVNGAPSGYVACTPLLAPGGGVSPPVSSIPTNLATGTARWGAGYFNDTIEILPEVKLVAGARYDVYWAQAGNTINFQNTPGSTNAAYTEQTDTFLSWRAGVLYQPTKAQTYYVSYSTSFNPSLEQLVSTTGTGGNGILPPENNAAWEAGAKYDLLGGRLGLSGAVFQITKYNARSNNGDGTFSAQGTIQVTGVRAGAAGRITEDWQVFGGYAYLDGRIVNGIGAGTTGMVPQNTPRDSASLWSTYNLTKQWELGGGLTYVGMRYANNTNVTVAPEYTRFDATAAYHFEKSDLRLNLFNLLNQTYYEQVIASDGGRVVPGAGFTAMLTYTVRL